MIEARPVINDLNSLLTPLRNRSIDGHNDIRNQTGTRDTGAGRGIGLETAQALLQKAPIDALARYYFHMMDQARGYKKDAAKRKSQMRIMQEWVDDSNSLAEKIK